MGTSYFSGTCLSEIFFYFCSFRKLQVALLICYRKKHITKDVLYSCFASQSSINCDKKLRKHFFLGGGIMGVHTHGYVYDTNERFTFWEVWDKGRFRYSHPSLCGTQSSLELSLRWHFARKCAFLRNIREVLWFAESSCFC